MNNSTKVAIEDGEFYKKVLEAVPHIRGYVKHRIYTGETQGNIPRNMYKTDGIIDDGIIRLYEVCKDGKSSAHNLKLKLFGLISDYLDQLYKNEEFHKNTLSTSEIIKRELELLNEDFEMDLDTDLLMPDELDDISYHQNKTRKTSVLYTDAEKNIIEALYILDSRKELTDEKRVESFSDDQLQIVWDALIEVQYEENFNRVVEGSPDDEDYDPWTAEDLWMNCVCSEMERRGMAH